MSRKIQEGFNLGLPNVVGYVSNRPDAAAVIPFFSADDAAALADFVERRIIGVGPEAEEGVDGGAGLV